jgi:parvulin-like peptidyl-prolyl isomerase
MCSVLKGLTFGRQTRRRMLLASCFAGVAALAFFWGRHGGLSQAKATPPSGDPFLPQVPVAPVSTSDYSRRVVAYIYNNIPITREELGEYLIARLGAERVDYLVNHRIIERACRTKGIEISDAEINAQLADDVKGMGITVADFDAKVLKRFNKTLFEYREDVIRPKLALAKFCRDRVSVTADDLKKAYEAKYGDKVQCRMIVLSKEDSRRKDEVYERVRKSDADFDHEARSQFIPALASKGGEVPPIHRHFPDPEVEKEAFSLRPGEVSSVLGLPDGTFVILKCVKHIEADTTKRMEDVHMELHKEIFEQKLAQEVPRVFQELRKAASPVVFLRKQVTQEDLERTTRQYLAPASASAPPPAVSAPSQAQELPLPAVTVPRTTPPQGN